MVYRLVYISKAARELSDQDLDQILSVSRTSNPRIDVTGLLLFLDGAFFQVLEGSKESVEALYDKISADDRHYTVKRLQEGEITERLFGDWSMAYLSISAEDQRRLLGQGDFFSKFNPDAATDEKTQALAEFISNIAEQMVSQASRK